jgi:DnaJ-domain-containing protein 1
VAQVVCPRCAAMLEVQGFGGAIKCPKCATVFPYAAEKRVRCPSCNKLTTIQDVRGMEFKCSHCNKPIFYNQKGDVVKNLSEVTIGVVNILFFIIIIVGWVKGGPCACGILLIVLGAIDAFLVQVRLENKPKVFLQANATGVPVNQQLPLDILQKLPILKFISFVASADGAINQREMEFIRRMVEGILRFQPNITEIEIQQDIMSAMQYVQRYQPVPIQSVLLDAQNIAPYIAPQVAIDFINSVCELGIADGAFDPIEQQIVRSLGIAFGAQPNIVDSIIYQYASMGQKRTTSESQRDLTNTEAFGILGLTASATNDEIKSRYRELAKRYHPDMQTGKSPADKIHAEEMMKLISSSYEKLKNERKL